MKLGEPLTVNRSMMKEPRPLCRGVTATLFERLLATVLRRDCIYIDQYKISFYNKIIIALREDDHCVVGGLGRMKEPGFDKAQPPLPPCFGWAGKDRKIYSKFHGISSCHGGHDFSHRRPIYGLRYFVLNSFTPARLQHCSIGF